MYSLLLCIYLDSAARTSQMDTGDLGIHDELYRATLKRQAPSDALTFRRYPMKEALLLLWSDCLAVLNQQQPELESVLRAKMMREAKDRVYPACILALGDQFISY